ncbi:PIN domain-containing protein [Maridesulfovibrio salexigens]|uniref:DUF4935 domain-containing protein n=1 Tax=Maridesulfovibrio salexigens (strain ATCC 14822 / DSM 2638 / NCIMB 8403 / VKM B-1763) TaxID=526222 RepID=C6BZ09_MARSD|nr:PIN domain-containing protein [Maridesulfovibrio salexigens]ACS78833.1 hypothetical protein Desal_0767 [Maridesulfovibrio salexigens DSM 2638]
MKNIYIDTNIIRKCGFDFLRPEYLKLIQLCQKYGYKIFIHTVVISEVETQLLDKFKKAIEQTNRHLGKLSSIARETRTKEAIEGVYLDYSEVASKVKKDILYPFRNWMRMCNVEVVGFDQEDAEKVFANYFNGQGCFSTPKCRSDLPDAFIAQGLKNLCLNDAIILCEDGRLLNELVQCAKKPFGIFDSYESFASFFSKGLPQEVEFDFSLESIGLSFTDSKEFYHQLVAEIEGYDWSGCDFDADESDTTIHFLNVNGDISIDSTELNENMIKVNCSFNATANIDFFIFKSDYYSGAEDTYQGVSVTDWNDHYFFAETEKELSITAECVFFIDDFDLNDAQKKDSVFDIIFNSFSFSVENLSVDGYYDTYDLY